MPERDQARAARGTIPYSLLAAVFLPAGLVYLWWFRSIELLRFAHPIALALIPLGGALVIWAGIRRAPSRHPVLVYSRAGEVSRLQRGWAARLADLLALLRLSEFHDAYPAQLSGGMRHRVSLGRMLAYQPAVMLMDEPFGALDFQTKAVMGRELLRIWETERRSILFVTHDIEEAVALADRVIVFSPRPARIIAEHRIDLPRPRNLRTLRASPEFTAYTSAIWQALGDDDPAAV